MKIYLDMNNYYRVFDDQTQLRIKGEANAINRIFELVDSEKCQLCGSFALEFENNRNSHLKNKLQVQVIFSKWSFYIEPDSQIFEIAKEILHLTEAGTYDSLHLACASLNNCEYFITCDDRFIRTIRANINKLEEIIGKIKIINPCDFIVKGMNGNVSR